MKLLKGLGFILVFVLTACQPPAVTPTTEPQQVEPSPSPAPTQAFPTPTSSEEPTAIAPAATEPGYPGPETTTQQTPLPVPELAYPDPSEAIPWEQARNLILDGQVSQVTQFHSLRVILVLEDGRTVETTEPEIDAVFQVIEECGEPCEDVVIATE